MSTEPICQCEIYQTCNTCRGTSRDVSAPVAPAPVAGDLCNRCGVLPAVCVCAQEAAPSAQQVEVCLGCGCETAKRDCGCPAGTGWRDKAQQPQAPAAEPTFNDEVPHTNCNVSWWMDEAQRLKAQLASAQQERDVAVRWIGDLNQRIALVVPFLLGAVSRVRTERDSAQAQIAELTARAEQAERDRNYFQSTYEAAKGLMTEQWTELEAARSALAAKDDVLQLAAAMLGDLNLPFHVRVENAYNLLVPPPSAAETTETQEPT